MPLLAALLSIPGGERHPLPSVSPQRRKKRTFDVLLRLLKQLAAKQPLLMVIEDLHWIDPTSLELLSLVIHQIQRNRILLIATARPEFKPSWPNHLHISTVSLSRLDHAAARALIEGVTQGKPIPSEILDQILTRTDGVPLFVEELTKTVLESGLLREAAGGYELTGALPPLGIPSTLHASLLARLDRLSSVKDVAQIGAAIGREFSYGLIAAVASLSENDLNAALAQLVDAELIFQRGVPPDSSYQFKHALVQDAAYSSLIRSRRQQLHAAIGRAIESEFPEVAATEPELLAYHYSEAHLPEPAVKYWLEAGRRASQRSADKEAVVQLERGLSLLKLLPESISRDRLELELQLTMGTPLVAMRGFTSPDFGAACERATHLAEKLDDAPQLFASLYAQFSYAMTTGKTRKALEFAERCQALGVARADRIMQLLAYRARGNVLLQLGKLASARDELARVFDLYDPVSDRLLALRYIVDPFVAASVHSSTTLLIMGFPDQAKKMQDQARKRATELKHINSIGQFHLFAGAELEQHMGNTAKLLDHARALSTLAAEHGVSAWGTHSAALEGWAIAKNGNTANGIATMEKGIAALDERGMAYHVPHFACLLAELYAQTGDIQSGLRWCADARERAERTEELLWTAELLRIEGKLRLAEHAKTVRGENCLLKAIEVARGQGAKLFELRAATELARHLRDQEQSREALAVLKPVHDWFTEGLDLPDLKDARALLAELDAAQSRGTTSWLFRRRR